MNILQKGLRKHTITCNNRFNSTQQRMVIELEKINGDEKPIVDKFGKLHAPVNGYIGLERDEPYTKGQYIPVPFTDNDTFNKFNFPRKTLNGRYLVNEEMIDVLKECYDYDGIDISYGRKFEKCGVRVGYVYIKASSNGYLNVCNDIISYTASVDKGVAPTGKCEVVGVVLNISVVCNEIYGTYESKMLVILENNSTVYGTIPSSIINIEEGQRVKFNGNFINSRGDITHSFYKRPTRAVIL